MPTATAEEDRRQLLRARAGALVHHPRLAMAAKAAVAAALAWVIALQLPGSGDDYAYYAPLGAVIAMYPTIASSARESLQGVAGIILGAAIALSVDAVLEPGAVIVAVVVGLGVLVGGWRWLGAQRSWVPIAALFVLVIGGDDPLTYGLSYAGLTLFGALIAIAINALLPTVPTLQVRQAAAYLQHVVVEHLDDLALVFDPADERTEPHSEPEGLRSATARLRSAVADLDEALHGNRRAKRYRADIEAENARARALQRAGLLVEDLHELLDDHPWDLGAQAFPARLGRPVARALRELAYVVDSLGQEGADVFQSGSADQALRDLDQALRGEQGEHGVDRSAQLVLGSIITTQRRLLAAVGPTEVIAARPT